MEINKLRNEVEPAQSSMSQFLSGDLLFSATFCFNLQAVVAT